MLKSITRLILLGFILLPWSLPLNEAMAETKPKIVYFFGKVYVKAKSDKDWKRVKRKRVLDQEKQIKTAKGSAIHIKHGSKILKISGDTELTLTDLGNPDKPDRIDLKKGAVWAKIPPMTKKTKKRKKRRRFFLRTRSATMGIRGTRFSVHAAGEKTLTCVCEGEVEVKTKGKVYQVAKGQGLDLHKKDSETVDYAAWLPEGVATAEFKKKAMNDHRYGQCLDCHSKSKAYY